MHIKEKYFIVEDDGTEIELSCNMEYAPDRLNNQVQSEMIKIRDEEIRLSIEAYEKGEL